MDDVCHGKLVLCSHCKSIVASRQTKGRIPDYPAKDMQRELVMQSAPPGEVGGAKRASRQNARFHTAAQRIIIDPN